MKDRQCGSCSECCFSVGVHEIDKRLFTHCPEEKTSKHGGCGVYAQRPPSCQSFKCLWLAGHFDRKDRPDRIGIVLATVDLPDQQIVIAWVRKVGAHERGHGAEMLTALASHVPICLLHRDGRQQLLINEDMAHRLPELREKLRDFMPKPDAYRRLPMLHDGSLR